MKPPIEATPVRQSTEIRRAEIVAAVLRLAATRSPAAITTGDMAAELGFSQGAVFRHFPAKDAIWMAVLDWVDAELIAALDAAAQQGATPLEGLERVFMAHIRFVVASPGVPRIIFHELQHPDDTPLKQRVRALLGRYRQILARLLDAAADRGLLLAGLDRQAAATLFIGTIQGLVMQSMLAADASAIEDDARRVVALYLHAIGEKS
ncbi:TetR/AcrR family transcriptional regulator [Zoogloea sp.]|uniref:TetR/AcrR family transcriptional regulator n=1 Tax=Zoogloea sp. TaxID=49181 RepID=UPI0026255550|nr:TetR/AcrR family transcriptional regulator [Zoogloea sp.]